MANQVDVHFLSNRLFDIKAIVDRYPKVYKGNVKYKSHMSLFRPGLINDLYGAINELLLYFRCSTKHNLFISTYNNMFSCHLLNMAAKISNNPLLLCCHSELNVVSQPKSESGIWNKLIYNFYKRTNYAKSLRLIVFGDYIIQNISPYIYKSQIHHFVSVDHPYFRLSSNINNVQKFNPKEIKIGIIGSVNQSSDRGLDNILSFASNICDDNIELRIVSRVSEELKQSLPNNICYCATNNEFIPRERYNILISELDYIYIPYPVSAFKFFASGALLEAIFSGKPVLMYRNSCNEYFYNKYGEYGIFIDDFRYSELKGILQDQKNYKRIVENQRIIMNNLDPINMMNTLKL